MQRLVVIPKYECLCEVLMNFYGKLPEETQTRELLDILVRAGEYLENHYEVCISRG